jgi:hypothetical protein
MRKNVRDFMEEEATGAVRSKQAKREERKKRDQRFLRYLVKKAEQIEANGNPASAAQFRAFWRKFPGFSNAFPETPK